MKYILITLVTLLLTASCTNQYYGHSKAEWNMLTHDERVKIKAEYKTIIDSRQKQEHEDRIKSRDRSIIDFANEGLYR